MIFQKTWIIFHPEHTDGAGSLRDFPVLSAVFERENVGFAFPAPHPVRNETDRRLRVMTRGISRRSLSISSVQAVKRNAFESGILALVLRG